MNAISHSDPLPYFHASVPIASEDETVIASEDKTINCYIAPGVVSSIASEN